MTARPRRRRGAPALAAALLLAACGGAGDADGGASADAGSPGTDADVEGEVVVLAAASLADAFDEIASLVEQQHPALTVRLTTDGSATLVTQLEQGAPADVLATADETSMQGAVDAGLVAGPEQFATNVLVIATPAGNPTGITGLADLEGLDVVTCAPEVPCGRATAQAFTDAGLSLTPVSEEQAVSAVVAKVAAGEADAGLVYATDVIGADGALTAVEFSGAPVNTYPIAVTADPVDPRAAAAFVEVVLSAAGQQVLAEAGFRP